MKIICSDQNLHQLKSILRDYLYLDMVIVEKGYEYEGMCYYFSMDHLDDLLEYLHTKEEQYILCYQEDRLCKLLPMQIVFIEGYSKEAFIYTANQQYITHNKLYELEEKLDQYHFVRINKSMIVNIYQIDYLIPDVQRRYIIVLKNKQRIVLTRSYVKEFMKKLRSRSL